MSSSASSDWGRSTPQWVGEAVGFATEGPQNLSSLLAESGLILLLFLPLLNSQKDVLLSFSSQAYVNFRSGEGVHTSFEL